MKNKFKELRDRYGIEAVWIEEVSSTNDLAQEPVYKHGDIIAAGRQTRGRGQRGNSWESRPGENLTFTLVLEPRFLEPWRQFLLSETVSLAVCDTLEFFGLQARIKWPNDIYLGDRKVCGILIENDIMGDRLTRSIAGIGINVNQTEFDPGLPNPVSIAVEAGRSFDAGEVIDVYYGNFRGRYASLARGGADGIEKDYHDRLYLKGIEHLFRLPDGFPLCAAISHVEPDGQLVVDVSGGGQRRFYFKEIEF